MSPTQADTPSPPRRQQSADAPYLSLRLKELCRQAPQAPPDTPSKAPTKAAPPKEHVEDLVRVKVVRRGKAVGHARTPPLHPVILAVAVICRSLLGVCQAAECLGHLCSSNQESGQGTLSTEDCAAVLAAARPTSEAKAAAFMGRTSGCQETRPKTTWAGQNVCPGGLMSLQARLGGAS